MIHVIFICTGNICRSAMADGYLKYRVKELGLSEKIKVTSAGTHAIKGDRSPINAIKAIEKYGVDISNHSASILDKHELMSADYILVMTNLHKQNILNRFPELNGKVKLLKEYAESNGYMEIDDPWGFDIDIYESVAKEIVECIEQFIQKINIGE